MIHPPLELIPTEDLPLVAAMAGKIWPEVYGQLISPEQIRYMLDLMYSEVTMKADTASGNAVYCWIKDETEPVGFCAFGPLTPSAPCEIHKLYVLPERHGNGYGKQAILSISRSAREAGSSQLELRVNRENADAIAFYRACDFLQHRSDCKDIGGGFVMDDFIFRKQLDKGRSFSS